MESDPTVADRRPTTVDKRLGTSTATISSPRQSVKSIMRDGVHGALSKAPKITKMKSASIDDAHSQRKKRKLGDQTDCSSEAESGMLFKKAKTELAKDGDDHEGNIEGDTSNGPSRNSSKQQKMVRFDMSRNVTAEVGRSSLNEIKRTVRQALEAHNALGGDSGGHTSRDQDYHELMEVFAFDERAQQRNSIGLTDFRSHLVVEEDGEHVVSPEELVMYLLALTTCAPLLKRSCVSLVRKLLAFSWLGRDEKISRVYVQFLAALVSAQGAYMRPVLEMLVDKFKAPSSVSWTVEDFPIVKRTTAQRRMHFGLQYLLEIFPAARPEVCKVMAQKFPFPDESKAVHLYYVDNLLRVREYAPGLGTDVLEMITSQLVKIDTEFQLDLSDMDDDLVARVVFQLNNQAAAMSAALPPNTAVTTALALPSDYDQDVDKSNHHSDADDNKHKQTDGYSFDGDGDQDYDEEDDGDTVGDASDILAFGDPNYDADLAQIEKSTKLVQKLDAILDRLFAQLTPVFAEPESDTARQCLEDMLSDFANFVLTVPSSRHTQFLVFHFSQQSPGLQDLFTGTLLNLAFESNRPSTVRQAAAAYLSSYVARAARVPRETVRSVAGLLCHRIEAFRRRYEDGCKGPDLRRYQELYTWVQALLYMFCFRWRDLVEVNGYQEGLVDPEDAGSYVGHDLEWMPGLREALRNIIYAAFNPLMVCSPAIVAEFAKLAHALRLLYVFPRLESNRRINLAQYASGRYGHGGALREDAGSTVEDDKRLQLEGNFPFDPYLLPVSKRWLEGDYVSWTPIAGVSGGVGEVGTDDEDDDEAEDEKDSEDGDGDAGGEIPLEEDTETDGMEEWS